MINILYIGVVKFLFDFYCIPFYKLDKEKEAKGIVSPENHGRWKDC